MIKEIFENAPNEIFDEKIEVKKYLEIVEKYLQLFPEEKVRLQIFLNYLKSANDNEICDWNNAKGHITCGAFLYSKSTKKFLTLHHKDLQMYLYAGGHLENEDKSPLDRARFELFEESGINKAKNLPIFKNDTNVPIDIDTHIITFNPKYNMPEHYHFDLRYLFVIEDKQNIKIDNAEMSGYKWITEQELAKDKNFGKIISKLKLLL